MTVSLGVKPDAVSTLREASASEEVSEWEFLRSWQKGTGRAIGSAGELFTGFVAGDLVKVSCPVQRISMYELRARLLAGDTSNIRLDDYSIKTKTVLFKAVESLGLTLDLQAPKYRSDLVSGLGMSAPATDAFAALRALEMALKIEFTREQVASFFSAAGLETVSTYPGFAAVRSKDNKEVATFTNWPFLALTVISSTRTFKKNNLDFLKSKMQESERVFTNLKESIESLDVAATAESATASAMILHELKPHALFGQVLELEGMLSSAGVKPLGYILAHDAFTVSLAYAGDMQGRDASIRASQLLAASLSDVKLSVSVSTKSTV